MRILFFCPRWGNIDEPEVFVKQVAAAGYDGIEIGFEDDDSRDEAIPGLARAAGLEIITQHFATFTTNEATHRREFLARLKRAASFRPLFITSQSGRDLWGLEANLRILDAASEFTAETGVKVFHETHRARCLHTPWRTAEILRARPDLRLVFDMSHWCNVCESLLADQAEMIQKIVPAVHHLHARVGHSQGPQVSDPRAPEWSETLEAHLRWWDQIIAHRRAAGAESLTITPEFGPPPYSPTLPYTRMPLVSQWEINLHMMRLLRARYIL